MTIRGSDLFDDPTAARVRASFEASLGEVWSVPRAAATVLSEFAGEAADPELASSVWVPLAALELAHGPVEPKVRDRALDCIASGDAMFGWDEADLLARTEREKLLDELRVRLEAA